MAEIFAILNAAFHWVYLFAPLWVPVFLILMFWNMWMDYIHMHFIAKQKWVLLEMKLPKIIDKSPVAMEGVISALYQKSTPKHILETYWAGALPPWFTLEIVSIGGTLRFFIYTQTKYRKYIESQVYSQYPTVEVIEAADDYTKELEYNREKYAMYGLYYALTKPDAYPIKTYIDYGLDSNPDEEFKVDPLAHLLEFMGGIKPYEKVIYQIVICAHQKEGFLMGRMKTKETWVKDAEKEVEKLLNKAKDEKTGFSRFATKVEGEIIAAIQRSMNKTAFNVYIRSIYISDKDKFDAVNITGLISTMKQFSSESLNGFKPSWYSTDPSDRPWTDFMDVRRKANERTIIDHFKRRKYYGVGSYSSKMKRFVLTTEELATLFHFPGQTASTPTLTRIPSKKAEAPSNLPV